MILQEQFAESCIKEVKIFKHLYSKILPGTLDFRPSEKQRSLKELLQFIMISFAVELKGIEAGKIGDPKTAFAEAGTISTDEFNKKMDELAEVIKSVMSGMTEEKLKEEINLFGHGSQTRTAWLFELVLKNLVGYKMQLFLYIKQSGNHDIGTPDLWRGQDLKK